MLGQVKLRGPHKQWLQRNGIDVFQLQRSVGGMKRIELEEVKELAPHRCERCGGLMRLIASEPHPDEAKTDLLTYSCMTCDEYSVVPDGTRAAIAGWFRSPAFDPETVKLLSDAYDKARKSLHDTGQPYIVNEVIAERIIALAKQGERNPDRLCKGALTALKDKAH
jgi:hypothetical protein